MSARPLRILITGSRTWGLPHIIREALQDARGFLRVHHLDDPAVDVDRIVVVHGAARGADLIAAGYAHRWDGWSEEAHPADWARLGKTAGLTRNLEMVAAGADLGLAFLMPCFRGDAYCVARGAHPTHGAAHAVKAMEGAGIVVRRYTP